jgi:hypothetical protein
MEAMPLTQQNSEQQIGPSDDVAQKSETAVINIIKNSTKDKDPEVLRRMKSLQRKICLVRGLCLTWSAVCLVNIPHTIRIACREFNVGNNGLGAVFIACAFGSACGLLYNGPFWGGIEKALATKMLKECGERHIRTKFDKLIFII